MVTKVIGDWNEFIADLIVGGANSLQIGEVLIQWGTGGTLSGGEREITYPIAYTTTPKVFLTFDGVGVTPEDTASIQLSAISTTAFTVQGRRILDGGAATNVTDQDTKGFGWGSIGINNA